MMAELVYHQKKYYKDGAIKEIKIWKVPWSEDKPFGYKYSLVYIVNSERIVGYDNSEGKGDHRHFMGIEYPYKFQTLERLWADFETDIKLYKGDRP